MFDMEQNERMEIKPTKIVFSFKNETFTLQNIPTIRYIYTYIHRFEIKRQNNKLLHKQVSSSEEWYFFQT